MVWVGRLCSSWGREKIWSCSPLTCFPLWIRQFTDHVQFMNADPGSQEHKIWQIAKKYGVMKCRLDESVETGPQYVESIRRQETTLLVASYIVDLIVTNMCAFVESSGLETNFYHHSDPDAQEGIVTYMTSAHTGMNIKITMRKRMVIMMELGFTKHSIKQLDFVVMKDTGSRKIRDCVSNRIIHPDHELSSPNLPHFRHLFRLTAFVLTVSLLTLVLELIIDCCKKYARQAFI